MDRHAIRLIGIARRFWGIGGVRPRGPHLLVISPNAPIPKCPKMPPICPKIPQNTPKYVLQDYRGVGGRALLPAKPISLHSSCLPYFSHSRNRSHPPQTRCIVVPTVASRRHTLASILLFSTFLNSLSTRYSHLLLAKYLAIRSLPTST